MRGLERKLDVLRAQLAACREGRDPGEAGLVTWSRLEAQSQRIAALETLVAELREQLAAASSVRATIQAHRPPRDAVVPAAADDDRARQEITESHRTLRNLGQALIEMTAREAYTASQLTQTQARLAEADSRLEQDRAAYEARIAQLQGTCAALLASTSWRISRPVRVVGGWWKRRA